MSEGGTTDAIGLYPPDKLQARLLFFLFCGYSNGVAYLAARMSSGLCFLVAIVAEHF